MKFTLSILLIISSHICFGQLLSKEIDDIYNFKPSKLNRKEQETKMAPLDKFWEKVKTDTAKYLPSLREELAANGHNPFFYYDGSGLLLSLTDSKVDKAIAIDAIAKCDITDIAQQVYVMTLNKLANEGMDVTKPALKILATDTFSFFIVQHALTYTQDYCLMYMLLPQQHVEYVDSLIAKFRKATSAVQKTIIITLWYAYTCKGDIFLQSLLTDKTLDKDVAKLVQEAMKVSKPGKDEQDYIKGLSKEQLNELRSSALRRFSDEGIDDLSISTRALRRMQDCR